MEEALKVLAQRIRRFPEGEYPPLPHPQLLNQLTDELLVAASDGVKSVAAEAPSISGNSALRLLAWTVADARSATTVLEKPLALTVGKRLDRQAGSVRAQLAGIRERAERSSAPGCAQRCEAMLSLRSWRTLAQRRRESSAPCMTRSTSEVLIAHDWGFVC